MATPKCKDIWIANFDDFKKIRLKSKPIQIKFYVFSLEFDVDSNIELNFNDVDREDCYIYYDKPGGVLEWDLNYLCKGYFFLLSKNLFDRYTEKNSFANFHNQKVFLKDSEMSLLHEFFQKAHDEFIKNDFSREILNSYASLLLAHIHSFYKRYTKEREIKDNEIVRRFTNLLIGYFEQDNQITSLPSVSYFAQSVCLSPNHFSNIIKKNTGKSPVNHIHNYMLLKAK